MSSLADPSPKTQSLLPRSTSRRHGIYRMVHWIAFIVLMCALGWAYANQARKVGAASNPAHLSSLEDRHLRLAQETLKDFHPDFSRSFSEPLKRLLPHRTDGVVQPLWPWLAAWLLDAKGASLDIGLAHARGMQLGWTLVWLMLIALACARSFTLPAALLVGLLVGFQGFLPTVGPFTSEALFQVLFLFTWVACIFSLQRNSLWTYGLVGSLGALAYLAEDRVLPLLIVFIVIGSLRAFWEWLVAHWPTADGTTLWVPRNHGIGLLLMAALFFFIAGPRLAESHQQFDHAFFTYHDQVRWLDNEQAAEEWITQHPATAGHISTKDPWEQFQTYRQRHTADQIWNRFQEGLQNVWGDFIQDGGISLGLALGLLILMFVAMKCVTPKATHAGQKLHPESIPALFFMLLATGTYIALAAWDAPISGSQQRLLLLQPPLALGILWGCESLLRRARRRKATRIFVGSYHILLWAILVFTAWQVIEGLRMPLSAP